MARSISKPAPSDDPDPLRRGSVIAGDEYPELRLRGTRPAPVVEAVPEVPLSEEEDLPRLVEEGHLRAQPPEACQRILARLLEQGRVSAFMQGAAQLMAALESDETETRRWSLATILAIASDEDQALVPHGTLPMLLGGTGRCLVIEVDDENRALAVQGVALLLGSLGVSGDLEGVRTHLARVIHDAGPAGAALRKEILSSKHLAAAPLRLFFREGRSVLDGRLLPFFRIAGADGARGLVCHLEEEENRQRRSRILEILKALAPHSLDAVKESLEAEAWYLVRNALNLLGELGDPQSFEAVSRFLEHPDPRIRRAATRAFWKTGGPRAESYLLDLLPRSLPEIQEEILLGLGQLQGQASALPIARLAAQSAEPLRVKCIEALAQLGQSEAIPTLAAFLERKGRILKTAEPAAVRLAAAKALAAIGTPSAVEALARAVREAPRNGDQETLRRLLEQSSWS